MRRSFIILVQNTLILCVIGLSLSTCSLIASPIVKNTEFVKAIGSKLYLNGKQFRFGGANIYWLGLDENVGGIRYPTNFRIDDALETAKDMGVSVVRSHTLGISVGNPLSLEPTLDKFNNRAFNTIDYSVYEAKKLGIHLIIPLTDNWNYYEGSFHTFTSWLHLPSNEFYSNVHVIHVFETYIAHLLNHFNPLTKLYLKNDPTIMAFELGNELNSMTLTWINTISTFIHKLAPHQLIAAGQQYGINPATLRSKYVSIVDCHYYPPVISQVEAQAREATSSNKVFIAGEYGSIYASLGLFSAMTKDQDISGAAFWSLFAHNDNFGYVQHNDGETVHYPGDSLAMRQRDHLIRDFNYSMSQSNLTSANKEVTGFGVPKEPPPGQPLITGVYTQNGNLLINWRGTTDALKYSVQEQESNMHGLKSGKARWVTLCNKCVTDDQLPLVLNKLPYNSSSKTKPSVVYYRVIPYNADGIEGKVSRTYKALVY